MRRQPIKSTSRASLGGFTLIEMVIAIAIIAIIAVFAVPSFIEFRERAVIRGSAEQLVTSVAQFRHEGIKRNRFVTVTFLGDVGSDAWCVGAEEGLDAACDCTAEDSCSVGRFPESVSERRGTTLTARSGFSDDDAATFDPSTGTLTELGSGGSITLRSPSERIDYRLRFDLNPLGRATLCVPGDARALPGYQPCGD